MKPSAYLYYTTDVSCHKWRGNNVLGGGVCSPSAFFLVKWEKVDLRKLICKSIQFFTYCTCRQILNCSDLTSPCQIGLRLNNNTAKIIMFFLIKINTVATLNVCISFNHETLHYITHAMFNLSNIQQSSDTECLGHFH